MSKKIRATFHVDFQPNSPAERDFPTAPRARALRVRKRHVVDHGRGYVAYDAHTLLELTSGLGRPGHLYE